MNTSAKGRRYENKVRKILESAGFLVIRSAASKGPFDLMALASPNYIKLIQVKVNNLPSAVEKETLAYYAKKFPYASVECWIFKDSLKEPLIKHF